MGGWALIIGFSLPYLVASVEALANITGYPMACHIREEWSDHTGTAATVD